MRMQAWHLLRLRQARAVELRGNCAVHHYDGARGLPTRERSRGKMP